MRETRAIGLDAKCNSKRYNGKLSTRGIPVSTPFIPCFVDFSHKTGAPNRKNDR